MLRAVWFLLALVVSGTAAADEAAQFELKGLDGQLHRLSDYRGHWVVVNYWAMWCLPCREEIPELIRFHERHKDEDAVVLGVTSTTANRERLDQFVAENEINYPVLLIEPGMEPLAPLKGVPATFLVAPDGAVVARKMGRVTADGLQKMIEEQAPAAL